MCRHEVVLNELGEASFSFFYIFECGACFGSLKSSNMAKIMKKRWDFLGAPTYFLRFITGFPEHEIRIPVLGTSSPRTQFFGYMEPSLEATHEWLLWILSLKHISSWWVIFWSACLFPPNITIYLVFKINT